MLTSFQAWAHALIPVHSVAFDALAWLSLGCYLLFAVVAYAYWPTLSAMFQIWWRSDTYTHGMLVPFISAWLIWRKREQLAAVSPRSMLWPVIPLALAVFAWLLGLPSGQ